MSRKLNLQKNHFRVWLSKISDLLSFSVEIMQRRLDPEGLGIILLNAFMDEFFPLEKRSTPDTFDLMHYNGIPGSNDGNKVNRIIYT